MASKSSSSHKFNKKRFFFYFCRIVAILALTALFIFPMGMTDLVLGDFETTATIINPWDLPFHYYTGHIFKILSFAIYLVPFAALFILISFFIKDDISRLLFTVTYVALSAYLICSIFCLMIFANTTRWFASLPLSIYIIFGFAFFAHFAMSITGIHNLRQLNPEYAEYKKIQKESKGKIKFSVKSKLTLAFIGTIFVILVIFMILILSIFRTNYTSAVSSMGRAQAERAAHLYIEAEGKYEKISQSFNEQNSLNKYAETPFVRIDMIMPKTKIRAKDGLFIDRMMDYYDNGFISQVTEQKQNSNGEPVRVTSIHLKKNIVTETTDAETGEKIEHSNIETLVLPDFDELTYTTAVGKVRFIPEEEKIIRAEDALEYVRLYAEDESMKTPMKNKATGTTKFIYPFFFDRSDGRLLQGFTVATYHEEILMKEYFHAQILVFTWSIIFLYLSVIIALMISDYISNPLLFLKTNVYKTSTSLSEILDGNSKITANNLVYTDSIRTNDEIKDLSKEIKKMVNLIKGIMPYISFSTLQNAEKEAKKTTSSRELCFLFTDIRGFTTLCENKSPKDVVELLNHYLDIETEIILNNGGDVDKFVGDEMMAFFSGPKKEVNACKAAMEIRTAMRAQQEKAMTDGSDYISIGIGINTGKVVFGSVGSRNRMDFTSIGDTVNLAARLESANKAYGSKSIITEAVYTKLKDSFICRELDFITVKGKTEPVRIYEILQTKASATDKLFEIKDLFEKGLKEYRKQNWDQAEELFRLCNEKYTDMPSVVFLDRIEHFKLTPPPKKWDGVFVMNVK